MAQPYDPKKAETFNKLVRQGLSEDAAAAQAGINDAPFGTYAIGDNGQMGAPVAGAGKVAGVDFVAPTAAETAESARFNQGLQSPSNFEQVDYAQEAKNPPSKVTPINYVTTSTEQVSGGGSTNQVSGPRVPNASSQSLQPAIDAKQAEINQFIKDNPSDLARKKQGLPPLSPEEKQQRQEKLDTLTAERGALKNTQIDAESTTPPTTTTVPNTTTTTETVTTGTTSTNQAVDPETDQKLSQENETQLDATTSAANASTARSATPVAQTQTEPVAATPLSDPTGVLASEDAAIAQQQAAQGDVDAFNNVNTVSDPNGVLAAEDAAIAEQQAAQGDADAFANAGTVRDPNGVLAAEDAAIAEQQAAQGDADAFSGQSTLQPKPVPDVKYDAFGNVVPNTPEAIAAAAQKTAEQQAAEQQAAAKLNAINQATRQSLYKAVGTSDWRVRLQLAASSDYLYNASPVGILGPLAETNGVIFPYTPQISTAYRANYEQYDLVHSNYRGVYYKNSRVDDLNIRCAFTAQDTQEADYLLAVIHFFRSVTKMFYGKDEQRGSPPPLVYLSGLGMNQFNGHPCVVTSFTYTLPDNVDYIRATSVNNYGTDLLSRRTPGKAAGVAGLGATGNRILNSGLERFFPGAKPAPDAVVGSVNNSQLANYVPTKMEIDITLIPVQTRSQVSKQFSLKEFANGDLIKGGYW